MGRRAKVLKVSERDALAGKLCEGQATRRELWVVAQAAALGEEVVVIPKDKVGVAP